MTRDVLTRPARLPDRTVRTGPGPTELYDVWSAADPEVTIVLVHGGFWRAEWDRSHLGPLAAYLADRDRAGRSRADRDRADRDRADRDRPPAVVGTAARRPRYAVAVPEYRRTGMPGGTWPGPGQDLAQALAAVRADADLPDRTVLVGHSAGGHLAVWLLHRPEAAGVAGAVSLAGCLDLRMVGRLGLDDGAADALLGAEVRHGPDAPLGSETGHDAGAPRWTEAPFLGADPMDLGPAPVPVHVLHGRDDAHVPPAVSRSWFDRCGTPQRDRLVLLEHCEHFDLIDPESTACAAVEQAIDVLAGDQQ